MNPNKKFKPYPSIVLLNYEGAVLKATKFTNLFVITDEWKEIVAITLIEGLQSFLDGNYSIVDSKGRSWNYTEESKDAKPNPSKLSKFISTNE